MSTALLTIPAVIGGLYVIRILRETSWGWVKHDYAITNKIFIIPGANTGLGFETAKALAKRGATVILACRDLSKAQKAIDQIRQETMEGVLIKMEIDLASIDSIKQFAKEIQLNYPKFDCLINNGGLSTREKLSTKDGFEIHCGVNHLGHFLLTNLLMENIKVNRSRVVVVSSGLHTKGTIDIENLGKHLENPTKKSNLYADSKLMNFYFAKELYERDIDAHVLCPGLCKTDFFRYFNPKFYHYVLFSPFVFWFLRSARQGAQNIIHCALDNLNTDTENPSKSYIVMNLKQVKSKINLSDKISKELWLKSAELCKC